MFQVYVLQSELDKSLYIGSTDSLKRRLKQHNQGENLSTKAKCPWKLIFVESYLNKQDTIRRERYLKTSQGARLLKRMLKEYFYQQK